MASTEITLRSTPLPDKIQYAKALADSGLLPTNYRRQPANVLYAIEYGDMLGLSTMAALTGVHVIDGKPTASAGLISALVRRAGHRLRVIGGEQRAVVEIVRADDPDFTFRAEWTLERAATAGLCTVRNGKPHARDSKDRPTPWEKYPAAMLKARAITECARDACEEALFGLHYTPEELGAEVDEDGEPVEATVQVVEHPTRMAAAGQQQVDIVDGEVVPDASEQTGEPVSTVVDGEQLRTIGALFERLGMAGKDDEVKRRRNILSCELVGRPLSGAMDMTVAEAATLIEELTAFAVMEPADAELLIAERIDRPRVVAEPVEVPA